jgi:hypothetical protein
MTSEIPEHAPDAFNLVRGGISNLIADRLGLATRRASRRSLKVALLLVITWVPLLLLSLVSGHFTGTHIHVPFLHDPEVHARFLIVLPLLELGEVAVALSLITQVRHLRDMGVVPERERGRFDEARASAMALRGSAWAEGAIVVLSYTLAVVVRLVIGANHGSSSWERTEAAITPAGWWLMLVSQPILFFFLLRWVWVFLVWSRFLYGVSRLDLELTPTHPDRAGGLGFLGWGLVSYAPILLPVSIVFSAGFAQEILHFGESLNSMKYHVIAFVVVALLISQAPLLAFSGKLARCRFAGLLEFGALAWRHDRAFDEKWIHHSPAPARESILGSADVQSMADIATCYEHVSEMRLIPFDAKAFVVLALAALVPMIPLVGTAIPLNEIFMKLGELLI